MVSGDLTVSKTIIEGESHSAVFYSLQPMNCSLPDSSVQGISQARILKWVAFFFYRVSAQSRDKTQVSCIACKFFTIWTTREDQN